MADITDKCKITVVDEFKTTKVHKPKDMDRMCVRCGGACCKHLLVPTKPDEKDFWEARGITVVDGYAVYPHRCPHLTDEGVCDIHDRKPSLCKRYRVGCRHCLLAQKIQSLRR